MMVFVSQALRTIVHLEADDHKKPAQQTRFEFRIHAWVHCGMNCITNADIVPIHHLNEIGLRNTMIVHFNRLTELRVAITNNWIWFNYCN